MKEIVLNEILNVVLLKDASVQNAAHFIVIDVVIITEHGISQHFGKYAQVRMYQKISFAVVK